MSAPLPTNALTSKWAGEGICFQSSDVPRGPTSGGRRTAAGWEGNPALKRILFGACNLGCIRGKMGQSSLEITGFCPFLGVAVLLSLQYGYNLVEVASVLWLQNFLWIEK